MSLASYADVVLFIGEVRILNGWLVRHATGAKTRPGVRS